MGNSLAVPDGKALENTTNCSYIYKIFNKGRVCASKWEKEGRCIQMGERRKMPRETYLLSLDVFNAVNIWEKE